MGRNNFFKIIVIAGIIVLISGSIYTFILLNKTTKSNYVLSIAELYSVMFLDIDMENNSSTFDCIN